MILLLVCLTGVPSAAHAGTPIALRLADESGIGRVAVGVSTAKLRGKVWVRRVDGQGVANVTYSSRCSRRANNATVTSVQWAELRLRPDTQALVWTFTDGTPCQLSFTATGKGRLRLVVRGY